MSKLTPEQVQDMAARRERGWSYPRLGRYFGISPQACIYRCLSVGAVSPRSKRLGRARREGTVLAFGRPVQHFTPDEDERLLELERAGLKLAAIAAATGRARTSVRMRLLVLGLREEEVAA